MSEQGEAFFEVSAYYSKAGPSLMLMEQGEAEQALALLPTNTLDEVSAYSRQRVLFRYAMRKAAQGETQTKRWFLEALPLLKHYDRYRDELTAFALSDLESKAYAGLAESYALFSWYSVLRPKDAFPAARDAALRAIALDDSLAEAHTAMA